MSASICVNWENCFFMSVSSLMTASLFIGTAAGTEAASVELEEAAAAEAPDAVEEESVVTAAASIGGMPGPVEGASKAAKLTKAVLPGAVLAAARVAGFLSSFDVAFWVWQVSCPVNPHITAPHMTTVLKLLLMRI
jgi:hypothetical protein